jgi:hypothetical protein
MTMAKKSSKQRWDEEEEYRKTNPTYDTRMHVGRVPPLYEPRPSEKRDTAIREKYAAAMAEKRRREAKAAGDA